MTVFAASAQPYQVLHSFTNSPDGARPTGLAFDGTYLYGLTSQGGASGKGTVFRVKPDGSAYFRLIDLAGSMGESPTGSPTLNGSQLYFVTTAGGNFGKGVVAGISNPGGGVYSSGVLRSFQESDGVRPNGNLAYSGGMLYGTMYGGIPIMELPGGDNVYRIQSDGAGFAVLTNLTGLNPNPGLAVDGTTVYGTTRRVLGLAFRLETTTTNYSVIKTFGGVDGVTPSSGSLVLVGSNLFGTTVSGGSGGEGTVFRLSTNGSDFAVLKSFPPLVSSTNLEGASPSGGLVLSGSTLLGVTSGGGLGGGGTAFRIDTDGGHFSVLKHFPKAELNPASGTYTNSEGANPVGPLVVQGGTLYGVAAVGGATGHGVLFRIVVPPEIRTDDAFFGVISNRFGFNVAGLSNQLVAIEVSSNLVNWSTYYMRPLDGSLYYFRDPNYVTNLPRRLYRLRAP